MRKDIPLLEGAVAYFVVQVIDTHPAGDHSVYIGRVEHSRRGTISLCCFMLEYQPGREKLRPTPWPQDDFSLFWIGNIDPARSPNTGNAV